MKGILDFTCLLHCICYIFSSLSWICTFSSLDCKLPEDRDDIFYFFLALPALTAFNTGLCTYGYSPNSGEIASLGKLSLPSTPKSKRSYTGAEDYLLLCHCPSSQHLKSGSPSPALLIPSFCHSPAPPPFGVQCQDME